MMGRSSEVWKAQRRGGEGKILIRSRHRAPLIGPGFCLKTDLSNRPKRHSAVLRANPLGLDVKLAAETIPESRLSRGNLGRFRQKPTAALGVHGSIQETGGESGIRTLRAGFSRTKD